MIGRKSGKQRRLPRTFVLCAFSLLMLLVSVSAFADTYNFYFTKPKKKGGVVDSAPAAPEDDEEEQSPPPAPAAPAVPATSAVTQPNQIAVTPTGQQPIIINNNNNISVPSAPAPYAPETRPVAPSSDNANESATVATAVLRDDYRYPWHFGLSTAFYTGRRDYTYSYDYNSDYGYSYYNGSYSRTGSQWAGLLNVGVDFNRVFGMNVYSSQVVAGDTSGNTFDLGGDFEITPFRISGLKYDYLRLGFMVGSSLAFVRYESLPVNVGARFTLNLDRTFGLTAAVRTNFGVAMAEAGIVTHF